MELTEELKEIYKQTALKLKGSDRRIFMAQIVKSLGKGGQRLAHIELGWCRDTIRKGMHELSSGFCCVDNFSYRGRKLAEEHLPNLLSDISAIASSQSQADPTFATNRLYSRISAREVREQLCAQFGYTKDQLPSEETIRVKLDQLGYRRRGVQKSRPEKKSHRRMQSLSNSIKSTPEPMRI